jgi:hypothetical protein
MAAAHLCLNRKLVYGEIIRKIGFQAFNFVADVRRHSSCQLIKDFRSKCRLENTRIPPGVDNNMIRPSALWCFVETRRVSAKHWSAHNAAFKEPPSQKFWTALLDTESGYRTIRQVLMQGSRPHRKRTLVMNSGGLVRARNMLVQVTQCTHPKLIGSELKLPPAPAERSLDGRLWSG